MSAVATLGVAPINTAYKGYLFRSRLEARWALFYDLARARWQYEVDPLIISGERYLPDFVVRIDNSGEAYHEVKPESDDTQAFPPSVYLAGKVSVADEWRGEASCSARSKRGGIAGWELAEDPRLAWVNNAKASSLCKVPFNHVGPFPSSCDHGCSHQGWALHMAETCGSEGRGQIVQACLGSIDRADIVCGHINTTDAFGTLVEVGIAVAKGKTISLTIEDDICSLLERRRADGHDGLVISHDMWFPMEAVAQSPGCESRRVKDAEEARKVHADFIKRYSRVARSVRLIEGLARAGKRTALTFGDPLNVAVTGAGHFFKADLAAFCRNHVEEAKQARAYRFDGR